MMFSRPPILVALAVLAVGIFAAAYTYWPITASVPAVRTEAAAGPTRLPTRAEKRALEAEAGNACRCARRLPAGSADRQGCWTAFERDLGRFRHTELASMCMPLSPQIVCFGERSDDCFVRDHDGGACTAEEARTLEAIWSRRVRDGDQQSMDRASREMDLAVQAFIRGERVRAPRSSGGCSG